jgi:hypothetical protein
VSDAFLRGTGIALLDALAGLTPIEWTHVEIVVRAGAKLELDHLAIAGGAGATGLVDRDASAELLLQIVSDVLEAKGASFDRRISISRDADGSHRFRTSFASWTVAADASEVHAFNRATLRALTESASRRAAARHQLAEAYGEPSSAWVLDAERARIATPNGELGATLVAIHSPPMLLWPTAAHGAPTALAAGSIALRRGPSAPPAMRFPELFVPHPAHARVLAELVADALDGAGAVELPNGADTLYLAVQSVRARGYGRTFARGGGQNNESS